MSKLDHPRYWYNTQCMKCDKIFYEYEGEHKVIIFDIKNICLKCESCKNKEIKKDEPKKYMSKQQ